VRKVAAIAAGLLALVAPGRIAYADNWIPLNFSQGDARLFNTGDGDWAPGYWKGECGTSEGQSWPVMGGVSSTDPASCDPFYTDCTTEQTHEILCVSSAPAVDQNSGSTLDFETGDDRRDLSTGDWAYGLYKGECAANSAMTGLAQMGYYDDPWGWGAWLALARCSPIIGAVGATNCEAHDFSYHDSRESTSRPDWDQGYHKGECSEGRYVKGVARVGTDANQARALVVLCCSAVF
jgi:hypothetical protein